MAPPTVTDLLSSDTLTFGVTAPATADGVAAMDRLGVESYWVGGHVASRNPSPEAVVALSVLAARTDRPIGTAILLLPLYPPAIVAKQFADLDRATGGRVVLGIGVGGEYPQEFRATQVPLEERGRRCDEAVPLIRRLWSGEEIDHDGPFFPMAQVRVHPAPTQPDGPPIVVSGRQGPAMRRAATLGDGWMPYMYSHRRYRESVERIHELAGAAGRPLDRFGWMAYVPVCVDDDGDAARRDAAAFLGGTYQQDFEGLVRGVGAAGTVEEVTARLAGYVEAGARHLIFMVTRPQEGADQVARLVEEVLPDLRALVPGRT